MDVVGRYLLAIIIMVVLLILAVIFVLGGTSIVSLNESALKRKASEEGNKKAAQLLRYKENEFEFSLFTRVSSAICICLATFLGTVIFNKLLVPLFENAKFNASIAEFCSTAIAFLVISFVLITIGMALPFGIATNKSEKTAFAIASSLDTLCKIFKPFAFLIIKTSSVLLHLFGAEACLDNSDVTEEEIRLMVEVGNEKGVIEPSEREMINNIFEFDDITAGEVMTHRTDMSAVNIDDNLSDAIKIATEDGFSRIPVYDDDIDNIVGILYVKDLLPLISKETVDEIKIKDFMRGVIYEPESARCRMLFREFKEKKTHMAVIVDEYGGTAGIVTMEDLLESIVGNIQDEYDQEDDEVLQLDENTYSLDGGMDIDDVEKLFGVCFEADEDADTMGGLIVDSLGYIPDENTKPIVHLQGIKFTVLEVSDRRIMRVKATINPTTENLDDVTEN